VPSPATTLHDALSINPEQFSTGTSRSKEAMNTTTITDTDHLKERILDLEDELARVERAPLDSFLLAGSRRIIFDSVKRYRASCIDQGPQLSRRPVTGKKAVGRSRKHRAEERPPSE
jgi:hypothetical protein